MHTALEIDVDLMAGNDVMNIDQKSDWKVQLQYILRAIPIVPKFAINSD